MSPKISVFDNLPKASTVGRIELKIILVNDIPTYIYPNRHIKIYVCTNQVDILELDRKNN